MAELNEYGLPLRRRDRPIEETDIAEVARQEQARRLLARRRLLPFILRNDPNFLVANFHRILTEKLEQFSEAVARQESPRLIVMAPPRHGKSELVSRNFPAWHLGRYPDHEWIACSYGADLAKDFSKKVRGLLADDGYHAVFPDVDLDPNSRAADRWFIDQHTGGYVAAGTGGPITGRGMHVGVIDDYVKNWEEADSPGSRDALWNWYESTFKSRLAPGGGIILMATRWHYDDLIGRVLLDEPGVWDVLSFPAIAEMDEYWHGELVRREGEALHPARYDTDFFKQFMKNPRVWPSLYQQRPAPEEGAYFKSEHFRTYRTVERPPLSELYIISTWDFAVGQKEQNDYTVGAVAGIDRDERVWALHQVRGHFDPVDSINEIIKVYRDFQPDEWGFEQGQINMVLRPFFVRRLVQEGIYDIDLDASLLKTGRKDKPARAKSLQGFTRMGAWLWPVDADWFPLMKSEFLMFPNGVHDDQVDAWAWMALKADSFVNGGEQMRRQPRARKPGGWAADAIPLSERLKRAIGRGSPGEGTTWMSN